MLNTMKAYKEMLEAGIEEKQATTITNSIAEAVKQSDLVTKVDLLKTEKKLETKISDLRNELINTEKKLDSKINVVQITLIKWMVGTMIAMTAIIIAVLK